MSKETTIKKIPLNSLINTLVEIYNRGVDYIDIIASPGKEQDKMAISFTADYMTDEGKKYFEGEETIVPSSGKLNDDDLNQLI